MHIEREALDDTLARLPGGAALVPDLQVALQGVVDVLLPLFGLAGAGLLVLDDSQALRYAAASNEEGRLLEQAQVEVGEGPCVDSVVYDVRVATRDVRTDVRWPALAKRLADAPVGAVLGLPVHLGGTAVGSLNVFADGLYDWDDSDVTALDAFGAIIEHMLGAAVLSGRHEQLVEQLQQTLDSRVVIERAIGLLMGRHGDDAVAAFNRLRRVARSRRRRVVDVARGLLAGEHLGEHTASR